MSTLESNTTSVPEPGEVPLRSRTAAEEQQQIAREFAQTLGDRRRRAGAPVRSIFAVNDASTPTLARLLNRQPGLDSERAGGGGRGGQVRVKLYVSMLWICARAPYEVTRSARAWAHLLGLPDPATRGARRIQDALKELQVRRMIQTRNRGGRPTAVTILDEGGEGIAYEPPSDSMQTLSKANVGPDSPVFQRNRYFRVPTAIWTEGYISRLSGPGFAMLLILLAESRGQARPVWFSPAVADKRFRLSESTRRAGLTELRELGLLRTRQQPIGETGRLIDFQRRRNVHELTLPGMAAAADTTATRPSN